MIKISSKYFFLIFLIITVAIVFGTVIYDIRKKESAKKNSKYTVAYITSDWHPKNNRGVGTDFIYKVKEQTVSKSCDYDLKKGTKYLVMYDSLKPSNYIMLGHHQLPDDVKAPYNGWNYKQIPIKLDSADLKAYFEKLDIE